VCKHTWTQCFHEDQKITFGQYICKNLISLEISHFLDKLKVIIISLDVRQKLQIDANPI